MKRIRHFFPKSLFGRFLLIVIMPIILAQLVATYMFYYRHWDNVAKDISSLIVQEIKQSIDIVDEVVGWGGSYEKAIKIAKLETGFELNFEKGTELKHEARESYKKVETEGAFYRYNPLNVFDHLNRLKVTLKKDLKVPFEIYSAPEKRLVIRLQLQDGVFEYTIPRKRIIYSSTYIFVLWTMGISILVTIISIMFLRNQVRSIKNLTKVAEKFGKGADVPGFKPNGAKEIRAAAS
jgi:two-component system osmolarity sensor histidine kinase EnvZ